MLIAAAGHDETVMFSFALARVHAAAGAVDCVCAGEAIKGFSALLPAALVKLLTEWLGPLSSVSEVFTEHPALTQLIGSSGRQSPPPAERTCARSPLPAYARSQPLSG